MSQYTVNDMTCGHCVGAITQALKAVDPQARIDIDLASHRVTVDSAVAGDAALQAAIVEAGYTPQAVAATAGAKGCGAGCGCGGR